MQELIGKSLGNSSTTVELVNKKVHIGTDGKDGFASLGIDLSDDDSDKDDINGDSEFADQLLNRTFDLIGNDDSVGSKLLS